ncbi:flavoprotein family protein [Leptospira ryugenii]|uniref:Flavoprotein family protein n=1 Tax=Leptospira ryugenii TaxID=1917863 RepID=A0A2P2E143_9LEPT|nr:NAD(P)/FAD-dependent oxidoreductase [Leptospira ryugenii]GBF50594.1 flavoprotein family protein [Leptospira ryugenii]
MVPKKIAIIGGGASGCFASIQIAEFLNRPTAIHIFEKSKEPLAKLRVSGGGRCNVTHHLFDPEAFSKKYPRGERELKWAFRHFQSKDTVNWFKEHGVLLKTEDDGRMFPVTDQSSTIIDCFLTEIQKKKIHLHLESPVSAIFPKQDQSSGFILKLESSDMEFDIVLVCSGSNRKVWNWMEALGHKIILPTPSLFTLGIDPFPLSELAGLSVPNASIRIYPKGKAQTGALLITHWGLSGPCALRLSAWEAKTFFECDYKTELEVNWLGDKSILEIETTLQNWKSEFARSKIQNQKFSEIPTRLWSYLLETSGISSEQKYADLSQTQTKQLTFQICKSHFKMTTKGVFKEEFVTAGGISRKEINFETMESRVVPNLFFAGEVIDVDGITGGFNFQNAWTTANIAAKEIAKRIT